MLFHNLISRISPIIHSRSITKSSSTALSSLSHFVIISVNRSHCQQLPFLSIPLCHSTFTSHHSTSTSLTPPSPINRLGFRNVDRGLLVDIVYDYIVQKIVEKVLAFNDMNYWTIGWLLTLNIKTKHSLDAEVANKPFPFWTLRLSSSYAIIDWGDTPKQTGIISFGQLISYRLLILYIAFTFKADCWDRLCIEIGFTHALLRPCGI